MKPIEAWTDGSAVKDGKGGYHGGAGVLLISGKHRKEISQPIPEGTNNISELTAAILALKALKKPSEVILYTDSQYVINSITKWYKGFVRRGWKTSSGSPVKNKELLQELHNLCQIHKVTWQWVKGHATDEGNIRADELAVMASEKLRSGE